MDRRKVLKLTAGATTAIAGAGVAGYFVLDRIFNPKTPLNYAYPDVLSGSALAEPTPECKGKSQVTLSQTEGPYYTPDTPMRSSLLENGVVGEKLIVDGFVLDTECRPVPGAVLDFWSCDGNGDYDNQGMRLRGHQFSDSQGYYRLETVRPRFYAAGPFGNRTAHIHVKVQGRNTRLLTTQLYFPDEEMNAQDSIFDKRLVVKMLQPEGNAQRAQFHFVIA